MSDYETNQKLGQIKSVLDQILRELQSMSMQLSSIDGNTYETAQK